MEESSVREIKAQLSTHATPQHSVSSANNRQSESLIKGPEKKKKPEVEISNKKEKSALAGNEISQSLLLIFILMLFFLLKSKLSRF